MAKQTRPIQIQTEKQSDKTQIDILIEKGIPLSEVLFHRTVQDREKGAETVLRSTGANPHRVAQLWRCENGDVLIFQFGKYSFVPSANCVYAWVE